MALITWALTRFLLSSRSKLVNCAQPGTIDERVINDKKGKLSRFEISENIQLALHSARGVGCKARRRGGGRRTGMPCVLACKRDARLLSAP